MKDPICIFKGGLINTPIETINWSNKLSKLTCTRHKNVLLRVSHREFYTKEKLHRYRLIDSPICPRCDQIENYVHKMQQKHPMLIQHPKYVDCFSVFGRFVTKIFKFILINLKSYNKIGHFS